MPDLATLRLYSMPSDPYDAKLLSFHMVGYRHVVERNFAPLVQFLQTAYAERLIDASESYDVRLLRQTLELVCKIA